MNTLKLIQWGVCGILLCAINLPVLHAATKKPLGYELKYSFDMDGIHLDLAGEDSSDHRNDFYYRYPYQKQEHHRTHAPSNNRPYLYDDSYYYGRGGYWRWARGGYLPFDAVIAGYEGGAPVYYCRAPYRHSIYYGKTNGEVCSIDYQGDLISIYHFKVLVN